MIQKLILEDYGKFKGREFELGPFTVVYGPNEAGKTTLFDALFEAACAGAPRRGQVWGRLAARYGEGRKARASGDVQQFGDAVEFLELFSIRAGQISVDAEKGGSWAEAAKNSLYRHGYNPAEIAEKLEKRASTSNATRHQKNLNRLNSDLAGAREQIAQLRGQEAAVAGAREGLLRVEAELAALEVRKAGIEAELAAADGLLEGHKKVRALHQAARDRDFTAGVIQAENKLAELAAYKTEAVKEYDLLLEKIAEAGRGAAELGGTINAALDTIEKLETESCSLLESQRAARRASETAQKLLPEVSSISSFRHGLFAVLRLPPGLRYGIWAFGAAGAALGLYLARQTHLGYALTVFFAAAAFAFDRYLYRPKDSPADLAAERRRLETVYDQWVRRGFERAEIERPSVTEVMEAMMNFKSMAVSWDMAVENNRKDGLAARAAVKALEDKSIALAEERENCALAAQEWLMRAGCASRDEYLLKANQYKTLDGEAAKYAGRVQELLALESCSSTAALLALLDSRVKELEAAGVRARPDYERDIAAGESKVKELAAALQAEEAALTAKKIERENLTATFNKDLAKIPESLNIFRRKEYDLEQEIAADALARAGAELAAAVYREIEADSSRKFAGLAREVGAMLARVLPASDLQIGSLALESVTLKDAGGAMRALDQLSSGTRDCFMLAARLTLAAAARAAAPGLLLLDDPFSALDEGRRAAALDLLKYFRQETGWQLIIFTKDRALLAAVSKDPQAVCCSLEA